MKKNTLSVHNLKKVIGKKEIIKGISFDVKQGEVFGFLGPNGAGKTTTIRMLVGLIKETEGTISIGGFFFYEKFKKKKGQIGRIVVKTKKYNYFNGRGKLKKNFPIFCG